MPVILKQEKVITNSYPRVYELKCTCNSFYFDGTKKKIIAQTMQHQQVNFKEKKGPVRSNETYLNMS